MNQSLTSFLALALLATATTVRAESPTPVDTEVTPVSLTAMGADKDVSKAMCYEGCEPKWTARVGLVYMDRAGLDKPILDNHDFDFEAGLDVGLIRRFGNDLDFEIRYFGIDGYSSRGELNPPSLATSNYNSELHSLEFNLGRQVGDRLRVLGGFRMMEMKEVLNRAGNPPGLFNTFDLNYDVDNRLYGIQLGAELLLWDRGGRVTVDTGVKAGMYYNNASANVNGFTASILPVNISNTDVHVAGVAEWDIVANIRLTDSMSLRCGYEVLWLEGVAAADGQVGNGNNIFVNSGPVYHGAIVGLEFVR